MYEVMRPEETELSADSRHVRELASRHGPIDPEPVPMFRESVLRSPNGPEQNISVTDFTKPVINFIRLIQNHAVPNLKPIATTVVYVYNIITLEYYDNFKFCFKMYVSYILKICILVT